MKPNVKNGCVALVALSMVVAASLGYSARLAEQAEHRQVELDNRTLYRLEQFGVNLRLYCKFNNNRLPNIQSLMDSEMSQNFVVNPTANERHLDTIPNPSEFVVVYERNPKAETRCILFADGRVKQISEADWLRLSSFSRIP